jgi:glycerol kinase
LIRLVAAITVRKGFMRDKSYLIALDQGTTSCRTVIFSSEGEIAASAQKPLRQHYPRPGWVEHDAEEIWQTQIEVLIEAVEKSGIETSQIAGLGLTNQRETAVLWDRKNGRPVSPAIVWQCRRTTGLCEDLVKNGLDKLIYKKTGLLPDAYFSATKWQWMFENDPELVMRAERGELLAGTIDSWLVWKLTAGRHHVTDPGNASRTMLMNLETAQWDHDLLQIFGLPAAILPEIVPSSGVVGVVDESILPGGIPISGLAGDQQAALFGQGCYSPGMVKNTYGTGCFILMQTGDKPVFSDSGLLTTVAWDIGEGCKYALEGSVFNAGSAIQWLRDELKIIGRSAECDALASNVADSSGVFFVPAFTGLGAPWWDMKARGTIVGLTRGSSREHIARAVLESIAFQSEDVISCMRSASEFGITEVRVDGGASVSDILMQMQSDFSQVPVNRPVITETTALGAAGLAGLAVGVWPDPAGFAEIRQCDKMFRSQLTPEKASEKQKHWHNAVEAARFYAGVNEAGQ